MALSINSVSHAELWTDKFNLVFTSKTHSIELDLDDLIYFSNWHKNKKNDPSLVNVYFDDFFRDITTILETYLLNDPYNYKSMLEDEVKKKGYFFEAHCKSSETDIKKNSIVDIKILIPNIYDVDRVLYIHVDMGDTLDNVTADIDVYELASSDDYLNVLDPEVIDKLGDTLHSKEITTTWTYQIKFLDNTFTLLFINNLVATFAKINAYKFYDCFLFFSIAAPDPKDVDLSKLPKITSVTKIDDTDTTLSIAPVLVSDASYLRHISEIALSHNDKIIKTNAIYANPQLKVEDMIPWILNGQYPEILGDSLRKEIVVLINPECFNILAIQDLDVLVNTAILVMPTLNGFDIYELFVADTKELYVRVYRIPKNSEIYLRALANDTVLKDLFIKQYHLGLYKLEMRSIDEIPMLMCNVERFFDRARDNCSARVKEAIYQMKKHTGMSDCNHSCTTYTPAFPNEIIKEPDINDIEITSLPQVTEFALDIRQLTSLLKNTDEHASKFMVSNLLNSISTSNHYSIEQKGTLFLMRILKHFNNGMHQKDTENNLIMNIGFGFRAPEGNSDRCPVCVHPKDLESVISVIVPMVENHFVIFFVDMNNEFCYISVIDQTEFIDKKKKMEADMSKMKSSLEEKLPNANVMTMIQLKAFNQVYLPRDYYKTLEMILHATMKRSD